MLTNIIKCTKQDEYKILVSKFCLTLIKRKITRKPQKKIFDIDKLKTKFSCK